jgi:2-oxoglutarate dehydrogenase E2 component (dihydrolipoamide succinyltransferase)
MILEMKVPSPGESITEVEIAAWLVKDGDYVEKDQAIAEVDSDKATLELPAEASGIITLKAAEGDAVAVGQVVCLIDTDGAKPAGGTPAKEENKNIQAPAPIADAPAPAAEAPKAEAKPAPAPAAEKTYASGTPSLAATRRSATFRRSIDNFVLSEPRLPPVGVPIDGIAFTASSLVILPPFPVPGIEEESIFF